VILLVVRHANAKSRRDWTRSDDLRPLNGRGRTQAENLIATLEGAPIARVLSSPAVRCIETVAPLADKRAISVEYDALLAEGARIDRLIEHAASLNGVGGAVLCSHGDVIPPLVETLAESAAIDLPADGGWSKGSTWVLDCELWAGGPIPLRLRSARYLPAPLPTGPASVFSPGGRHSG